MVVLSRKHLSCEKHKEYNVSQEASNCKSNIGKTEENRTEMGDWCIHSGECLKEEVIASVNQRKMSIVCQDTLVFRR